MAKERYDASKKVYTDVPMLDEIVHNLKLIIQDIVIKDKEEADNSETAESITAGELYVSAIDNTTSIHSFRFNREMLEAINVAMGNDPDCTLDLWTDAQIDEFVKGKTPVDEAYYPFMVKYGTQYVKDNYVEKNNYYRMLNGEPDYGTPDLYVDVSYIPSKYRKHFIEPSIDNRQYILNDPQKYYFAENHAYVKAAPGEGKYQADPLDEDNYVLNSNIKWIYDQETEKYVINKEKRYALKENGEYFESVDGEYIYDAGYDKYRLGPQLYIRNPDYITGKQPNYYTILAQRYLRRKSLTQLTESQLAILKNAGVLEKLIEDNPTRRYINYVGSRSIDYYTARKADIFEILYIPEVEELVKNRFMIVYDKERMIYLKRYYSLAYKQLNPYYDKFFIVMIVGQVYTDLVAEVPEWYIRRDVFDLRTCQYILESNGIKFFRIIPLKYQIGMVRRMTQLIKYKSTTRCFYDLAELFGLQDVTIYKHYIIKTNKLYASLEDSVNTLDIDGGYEFFAPITFLEGNEIDGGYAASIKDDYNGDKDGGRALWDTSYSTLEDLLARYSLYFMKVPIGDTLDNYIHDAYYSIPYDSITTYDSDPYWDGENDHDTLKYTILQKDFTTQSTKYLSLNSNYKMLDYQFQQVYFLNLLMNNRVECGLLTLPVPAIEPNTNFKLKDLIILLYCFATKYYPPQLREGICNKVFLNNRDPKSEYISAIYHYLGTYNPDKVFTPDGLPDLIADGGMARDNVLEYTFIDEDGTPNGEQVYDIYEMDGGKPREPHVRMINVNGGPHWPSKVPYDYPETELDIFDPYDFDDNMDGAYAITYNDPLDLDGGMFPRSVQGGSKDCTYDGGTPWNAYVYMMPDGRGSYKKNYGLDYEDDPCEWFWEFNDKFRYPTIDLTNRIDGFNMEANLKELHEAIYKPLHPRREWCRGYHINEVLPTKYTPKGEPPHYFEYNTFSEFPFPGVIGDLLQDISTGKYYMWGWRGYFEVKHVYKYGIQHYLTPTNIGGQLQYDNPQQLLDIYYRNKQIYEDLIEAIDDCEDQDEYWILRYCYEYLFTMEWDLSYYDMNFLDENGEWEYRQADTFHEYIENKNALMYQMYENTMAESNDEIRMYNIGEFVDKIIDSVELYLETDALQYIFYFMPSRSWNQLLAWLSLLIDFFKSYKTYMLEIGANMVADDKYIMRATESDHMAFKKFTHEWADAAFIDDEYEMEVSREIEDSDLPDYRFEDRMYVTDVTSGVIDLNGAIPTTSHYALDFDGAPDIVPINTSKLEDNAADVNGGWYLESDDRTEDYDGGCFINGDDPMGFLMDGGYSNTKIFSYNINGGSIPILMSPSDPIADGASPLETVFRDTDYDAAEAEDLIATIYMYVDGGYSYSRDYNYFLNSDGLEDAETELLSATRDDLDAGGPSDIVDYGWLDESMFAEFEVDGGKPDRITVHSKYINGHMNTETYSRPFDVIDVDINGGCAPDSDYYIDYNAIGVEVNDIMLTELDGGWYAKSPTSLEHDENIEHRVRIMGYNSEMEPFASFFESDAQYIDLDGGNHEDRTADDPVTEGYVSKILERFVEVQKARVNEVYADRYDPYNAANDAERIARSYLDTRLKWNKSKYDAKTHQFIVDQPELIKTR